MVGDDQQPLRAVRPVVRQHSPHQRACLDVQSILLALETIRHATRLFLGCAGRNDQGLQLHRGLRLMALTPAVLPVLKPQAQGVVMADEMFEGLLEQL